MLVHIAPGIKESTDCCKEFIEDMRRRGLNEPLFGGGCLEARRPTKQ